MRKSRQYASVASSRRAESAIQCHGLFIPFRIRWVSIFALSPIRLPVLLWESRVSTCQYHLQYYLHVKYYFALPPLTHSGLSKSVYYISSFVRHPPGPILISEAVDMPEITLIILKQLVCIALLSKKMTMLTPASKKCWSIYDWHRKYETWADKKIIAGTSCLDVITMKCQYFSYIQCFICFAADLYILVI